MSLLNVHNILLQPEELCEIYESKKIQTFPTVFDAGEFFLRNPAYRQEYCRPEEHL